MKTFQEFLNENTTSYEPDSGEDRAKILDHAEKQGIKVKSERNDKGHVELHVPFNSIARATLSSALKHSKVRFQHVK